MVSITSFRYMLLILASFSNVTGVIFKHGGYTNMSEAVSELFFVCYRWSRNGTHLQRCLIVVSKKANTSFVLLQGNSPHALMFLTTLFLLKGYSTGMVQNCIEDQGMIDKSGMHGIFIDPFGLRDHIFFRTWFTDYPFYFHWPKLVVYSCVSAFMQSHVYHYFFNSNWHVLDPVLYTYVTSTNGSFYWIVFLVSF